MFFPSKTLQISALCRGVNVFLKIISPVWRSRTLAPQQVNPNSTYDEGPFILLNHNGSLNDVFTIAHEAGHSIHTCYSNESQPYELANYRIFVAEIASTLNEQVLLDYMLKNTNDKNERIVLLEESIDGLV